MSDAIDDLAIRLETLLPRAMRLLFKPGDSDPLADVPVAQLRIMRQVYGVARTPSEIGESLGMSASAVTQIVNRMIAASLVERCEDPEDRRVRRITMSEFGAAKMRVRHNQRVASSQHALRALSPADGQALVEALQKLVAACSPAGGEQEPTLAFAAELEQALPLPPAM